ncbi:MAG: heme-binding domain-containing protein [Gemmatimonadota bacterium]|nr:heme-binding domain-containing protein [Gemmatimonadota bacterium]MDH3424273.1 heme-binding domain-containing protein [Gemmatimonadota bacterium]
MPPRGYALMHAEARLTDGTLAALLKGFRATLAADPPVLEAEEEAEEHGHN